MKEQGVLRPEAGVRVVAWLAAVDEVGPGGWQIIADASQIPAHARADSHYWCELVFAPEANPHDVPQVARAIHRGGGCSPDLIRYDYEARGLHLQVIEGRNFVLVRVDRRSLDLLALPEPERALAVTRAAEALFRQPLCFCHCEPLANGSLFCTSPTADPRLLASWAERAEGGVRDGELWFAAYKRVSQLVGFANPNQWFRDAGCGIKRAQRLRRQRRRARP